VANKLPMQYCTFSYNVHYNNRKVKGGLAPYRGEHIDNESLTQFVKDYFSGAEDSYNLIEVQLEKEYDNEEAWINAIIDMDAFRYLQKVNGYAGELIMKYM
jgi:Cft2 family RNA processing exonuclease